MENVTVRDGDEELALFLEMRRLDKEDPRISPPPGPSTIPFIPNSWNEAHESRTASSVEKLLDSGKEAEWNPAVELEETNVQSAVLKPRLENILEEPVSRNVKTSRRASLAPGVYSLTAVNKQTIATAEQKPSTKPLKQATSISRPVKLNSTESRPSISTKSAPMTSTLSARIRTTSSKPSSHASALTRSSSVGKSAPGAKPPVSKISEIPGRSISASRGRAYPSAAVKRGQSRSSNEVVNPVLIGTKMVERVVNMRKLPPPRQGGGNSTGKSEGSGFGRNLSRSSLDMALRHMDIRRSMR
ncbi:PREDICTED: uncharacterized protein LOC104805834 [Tarenaya hassleriana]|uniref:uncharacterized protein LOC104805834 n=1 Tax=Tarenaya hassleriana TaxID=28532 RepID=UPI00053C4C7E|nr:PREDICTED: uncharacterized protein LOC104805834 [Tarenaya hassleriana]